jgi:hypothetical protein
VSRGGLRLRSLKPLIRATLRDDVDELLVDADLDFRVTLHEAWRRDYRSRFSDGYNRYLSDGDDW